MRFLLFPVPKSESIETVKDITKQLEKHVLTVELSDKRWKFCLFAGYKELIVQMQTSRQT